MSPPIDHLLPTETLSSILPRHPTGFLPGVVKNMRAKSTGTILRVLEIVTVAAICHVRMT